MNNQQKKQKGAVSIIVAMMLLMIIGFMGLAIDVGFMQLIKNRLQNVADASALACIIKNKVAACGKLSTPYNYQLRDVSSNTFTDIDTLKDPQLININPSKYNIFVAYPYPDPALSTCPNGGIDCALAVVSTEYNPIFMSLFPTVPKSIKIDAKAIAGTPLALDCFFVQNQLTVGTNNPVTTNNCNVSVGNAGTKHSPALFSAGTNAQLNVNGGMTTIYNNGSTNCTPDKCGPVVQLTSEPLTIPASFTNITPPMLTTGCQKGSNGSVTGDVHDPIVINGNDITYSPGLYCDQISLTDSKSKVFFKTGSYTLNGGMRIDGPTVSSLGTPGSSDGNFFYINNSKDATWLSISAQSQVNLFARNYSSCTSNNGMLFFVNSATPNDARVNITGGAGINLYGNLDFYNSNVSISGNGSNSIVGTVIAYDFTVSGDWTLTASPCSPTSKARVRLLQ